METNQFILNIKISLVLILVAILIGTLTMQAHLKVIETNTESTNLILNEIKETQYIQLCHSLYPNTEDFRTCIKSPMIPF